MSNKEIISFIERYTDEIWNGGNLDKLSEFVGDTYVEHNSYGDIEGLDGFRQFVAMTLEGFPDFKVTIDNCISQGELLGYTYVAEGTHEQDYGGLAPTGNRATVDGCFLARLEDGKLVEGWNQFDLMGLMVQLEAMGQPEGLETGTEEQFQTGATGRPG